MSDNEQKQIMVNKVVLSTGKEVLLREIEIRHTELAAQAAAPRSGNNETVLGINMQKELLKLLIVQVNGGKPSGAEMENLDKLFTFIEYKQLMQVLKKMAGEDDQAGKFQLEVVAFGGK